MFRLALQNRDLLLYVRRRRVVRMILFIAWVALLGVCALFYNRSHEVSILPRIVGWRLAVWILAAVVSGLFLFRVPQLFLDRSFEGIIVRSGLSHSYSSSADPKSGRATSYGFRLNTVLLVRTPNGKLRRIRFEEKPGFYLYYHEGNYIRHISGLPYPIADPARMTDLPIDGTSLDDDSTGNTVVDPRVASLCAACGHFSRASAFCPHCGHSLIDPKSFFRK